MVRNDSFHDAIDSLGIAGADVKGLLTALVLLGAAIAVDQYYNLGRLSDGALSMLREIQRNFGF
jgi:hypothetical protein